MRPHPRVLKWLVITLTVIVCAGPPVYGFLLSLRPFASVAAAPLSLIPSAEEVTLEAYPIAMGEYGLGGFMLNSLQVALATVVLAVLFSVLGGYAAVRLDFFGRRSVNVLFLGVYMLPGIVLAVPLFVLLSRVGLTGTLIGLVLVYIAQTVPVALYMLRNYFIAVPASVEEAAMIDGCGRLALIRRVVLPMALPGIAATSLYVFMIAWNEYPVRAAVPRARPAALDGGAGHLAAHRVLGAGHRADGRVHRGHHPGGRGVLPGAAVVDLRAHRRSGERMKDMPVRLGILGAGSRGRHSYGRWIVRHPERAQIAAVADPIPDRRDGLAATAGVPDERRYHDWKPLLADAEHLDLDGVIVALPDRDHVAPTLEAARHGLAVLVEKPVSSTPAELEQLADGGSRLNARISVGHVIATSRSGRLCTSWWRAARSEAWSPCASRRTSVSGTSRTPTCAATGETPRRQARWC